MPVCEGLAVEREMRERRRRMGMRFTIMFRSLTGGKGNFTI